MSTIQDLFEQAQLAEASYTNFAGISSSTTSDSLAAVLADPALDGKFSQVQASAFSTRYQVESYQPNTGSGFSATLFFDTTTGQYTYAIRGTEFGLNPDLWIADAGIAVNGLAVGQTVDMYNDWIRINAKADQAYQALVVGSNLLETAAYNLAIAGQFVPALNMTAEAYLQYINARTDVLILDGVIYDMSFKSSTEVFSDERQYGLGTLSVDPAQMDVVGHSLGGNLAAAFTRMFPFTNVDATTINGAGFPTGVIPGLGLNADTNLAHFFSFVNGASNFNSAQIQNIHGDGIDFVTMNNRFGLVQQGANEEIYIESMSLGNVLGHGKEQMTDSLAVYSLFAQLDPGLNTNANGIQIITDILKAESNVAANSLESAMAALGRLFNVPSAIVTGNAFDGAGRDNLYKAIDGFNSIVTPVFSSVPLPTIQKLTSMDAATLAANAQADTLDGLAYRYALRELNPFVALGTDYSGFNQNGELNLYDASTHSGNLTAQYLIDRAAMLQALIAANTKDASVILDANEPAGWAQQGGEEILYRNYSADANGNITSSSIYQGRNTFHMPLLGGDYTNTANNDMSQMQFGSTQTDTLTGGNKADDLYGMGGDDTLTGGGGNDYLEGGAGNDTYIYTNGGTNKDGLDTILDSDGNGKIVVDGAPALAGGAQYGDSRVHRDASGHLYVNAGSSLIIDNTMLVLNYSNGNLGLNMDGPVADVNPVTTRDINGDLTPVDPAQTDDLGNLVTDGSAAPDRADTLYGSGGNDHIMSGGGNDLIYATQGGDDVIDAGSGRDYVAAGNGNNVIIGGADGDALVGGTGNDRIYADGQISVADAIVAGNLAGSGMNQQGDWLTGGSGDDTLIGSNANDVLMGGGGADLMISGAGDDDIMGDANWVAQSFDWTVQNDPSTGTRVFNPTDGVTVPADSAADVIYAGEGNDHAWGGAGNDIIFGEGGNDILMGDSGDGGLFGNDYLDGGSGNDTLYGEAGDDILVGGTGNDILYGGAGQDIYIFNQGDGSDTVYDSKADNNIFRFGTGISASDITLNLGSLKLNFGNGDEIHIANFDQNDVFNSSSISSFEFDDGTVLSTTELLARGFNINGTAGADTLTGTNTTDRINGLEGDDALYGGDGNDVLDGGAGNDRLEGGRGSDTYLFGRGSGQDTIYNLALGAAADKVDAVQFAADVLSKDVTVRRTGETSLTLSINGTTDTLTIADYFYLDGNSPDSRLEEIRFADTVWTVDQIKAMTSQPTSGDDELYGFSTNDVISGGDGNDIISGLGGDDVLNGDAGNDILSGDAGNDTLNGGAGNDWLEGNTGNDVLEGGSGNDVLNGNSGDDTLSGGAGTDNLYGGAGNDTYLFGRGSGQDTIEESEWTFDNGAVPTGNYDVVQFAADVSPSDIVAQREWDDLVLTIRGTTDVLRVKNYFYNNSNSEYLVEAFRFADGTEWTLDQLKYTQGISTTIVLMGTNGNDVMTGGAGNELLNGMAGNDVLSGGDGNDILNGGDGNDVLDGGLGNDTLLGQTGNDCYLFGRGSGQDTIQDYDTTGGNLDTIRFAEGIAASDITLTRSGMDMVMRINGTNDKLTVQGWGYGSNYYIEQVEFADGTSWDAAYIQSKIGGLPIIGTNGDDFLWGGDYVGSIFDTPPDVVWNSTLEGRGGNDILVGGAGNDTYVFNRGDGQDKIDTRDFTPGKVDTIQFGAGIAPSDITFTHDGYDLILGIKGTTDQMLIWYWGSGDAYRIQRVKFDDGTTWDTAYLYKLAAATPVIGTNGNDFLQGWSGGDASLHGLGGSDVLFGSSGNDTLDGGTGNDYMYGGSGNDVYLFNLGDGQDTINDNDSTVGNLDTLRFGAGIAANDITFSRNSRSDLVLSINGTTDQITMEGWSKGDNCRIERVEFADGSAWDAAFLEAIPFMGTNGNDRLIGDVGNNTLLGLTGSDMLFGLGGNDLLDGGPGVDWMYGGYGDDTYIVDNAGDTILEGLDAGTDTVQSSINYTLDANVENLTLTGVDAINGTGNSLDNIITGNAADNVLAGGTGNDVLAGGAGNDTYLINAGDGIDTIVDNFTGTEINTIVFGSGVDPTAIKLFQGSLGLDLGDGTVVHIQGVDYNDIANTSSVQSFQFADGTVLTAQELVARGFDTTGSSGNDTLSGTNVTDRINGGAGDDILIGGQGDDILMGGSGNDCYVFDPGDGADTIVDSQGSDTLYIGGNLTGSDLEAARDGDNMVVKPLGTTDSITLTNWFTQNEGVNRIEFGDGTSLDHAGIEALMNRPPIANPDAITVYEDGGAVNVTAALLANDTDPDANDVLSVVSVDASGTAVSLVNGEVQYDIGTGYQYLGQGQTTADTFSYTIADTSDATSTATVNVTITGVNDAPVTAADDATAIHEDITLTATGNVLSNDTDVDQGTVLGVANAGIFTGNYGSLTLKADGSYSYVLDNASNGVQSLAEGQNVVETFTYQATDGLVSTPSTLTVTITGTNDAPVIAIPLADQTATETGDLIYHLPPGAFTDIDQGDTLSYSATLGNGAILPNWLTFDAATLTFSATSLPDGAAGLWDISVAATDTQGAAATSTFQLDIANLSKGNARNDTLNGTPLRDVMYGLGGNDYLKGGNADDTLVGGSGNDVLEGGQGNDTLIAGIPTGKTLAGAPIVSEPIGYDCDVHIGRNNDTHSTRRENNLLNGGAGTDTLIGADGADMFIGGTGNDLIQTGQGRDIIAFNRGDGHDTVLASPEHVSTNYENKISARKIGGDNTLSLGGGIKLADLAFLHQGNDLILQTGPSKGPGLADQITLQDWYVSADNHSIANLQLIADSPSHGRSHKPGHNAVCQFDFAKLVKSFDHAVAANGTQDAWSLTNALLDKHLEKSGNGVLGGDLAWQYAINGDLTAVSLNATQNILGSENFGIKTQQVHKLNGVRDGVGMLG